MPDGGGSVGSSLRGGERNVSSTVVNLALGSFETDCPGASSGPDVVFCRCLGHPTGTLLTPRVLLNCYFNEQPPLRPHTVNTLYRRLSEYCGR